MKEIIVNGINVAECYYYFDNKTNKEFNCANDKCESLKCKENKNCDFKMLMGSL